MILTKISRLSKLEQTQWIDCRQSDEQKKPILGLLTLTRHKFQFNFNSQ